MEHLETTSDLFSFLILLNIEILPNSEKSDGEDQNTERDLKVRIKKKKTAVRFSASIRFTIMYGADGSISGVI